MGTMEPKEVGRSAEAGPITVQPFRYTEFVDRDETPRVQPTVAPVPPTQKLDRSKLTVARGKAGWAARALERAGAFDLPLIGSRPMAQQIKALLLLLGLFVALAVAVLFLDQRAAGLQSELSARLATAMVHTQRLARAATAASEGNAAALAEMRSSRDEVNEALQALARSASGPVANELQRFADAWKPVDAAAAQIAAQEKALIAFAPLLAAINESAPRLTALADEVTTARLQQNAPGREMGLLAQMMAAAWRLAATASQLPAGGAPADAGASLTRDVAQLREIAQSLAPTADSEARSRLQQIAKIGADLQTAAAAAAPAASGVAAAAAARATIQSRAEALRQQLASIESLTAREVGGRALYGVAAVLLVLLALATVLALIQVLVRGSRRRAQEAEAQRLEAQRLEREAKKANEKNQAAILRLMNELQEVADGNLTVQATVTEDITGAIADTVNYTVEELRALVGRINSAAEQVTAASTAASDVATQLLAAAEAQAHELKDTGANVLQMTAQIGEVSRAAGESAQVARVSLETAERGQRAVYNQIAGMNEIREQIQETAKRIKRLGESSQEIGEIVELISDITEQTNVLALNAAIQAAAAGEAGRGFSVVAEEVQRLADRSAEAAKQIAALVKTIQTDTQDAVAAMEKSTQGVVEGTKLSDAAGKALADIGRVSRQLAELIERIAGSTQEQASSADGVAHAIERLLGVNEQATEGTRRATEAIGQLAGLARELKESVARFRVA